MTPGSTPPMRAKTPGKTAARATAGGPTPGATREVPTRGPTAESDAGIVTYTIGGVLSGLGGTVVLSDNGSDALTLTTNGDFTFGTRLATGQGYDVTVTQQPSGQTCGVSGGSGSVAAADVTGVQVTCTTNTSPTYTIGGTVTGLQGALVLQDNGGDNLPVSASGAFTFATPLASAQAYAVTVLTQPTNQRCTVSSGAGNVAGTNVTSVEVSCAPDGTDVLVVRIGDGSTALSSSASPVFLEHWSLATQSLVGTVPLPTAASGTQAAFALSGTAVSEGGLALSGDFRWVTVAGYAATPGTAAVASTASAATNRIVARVGAALTADTSTHLSSAFSSANVRGAASEDGSAFWVSGSAGGVEYVPLGGTGASTNITSTPSNMRWLGVFGGQLYGTTASSPTYGVVAIGSGLPTTGGQTGTLLSGFPTTSGPSPYGFAALDLSAQVAGVDTIYVAEDATPGANAVNVQKWTSNGTSWTQVAAFAPALSGASIGARGLCAFPTSAGVVVVATSNETTPRLLVFTDTGTNTPAVTVLGTAPSNTSYRGVAWLPSP